jgi:selenocysteine lyase/cysteine desulfurase
MLMKRWNTTGIVPGSMTASLMNIRLPCSTKDPKCWRWSAEELQKKLESSFNIWVFYFHLIFETFLRGVDGIQYIRISCQIYNEMNDYVRLANAIQQIYETPEKF